MTSKIASRAESEFGKLLEVLEGNHNMVVLENAEEWEDDEKPPQPAPGEKLRIPGSIVSIVERLDDELTRSLQHIDPHTAEYIERLSDEQALYTNIVRGLLYVEDLQKDSKLETTQDSANRVVMRWLEHIYFKVCRQITAIGNARILTIVGSRRKLLTSSKRLLGRRSLLSSTRKSLLVGARQTQLLWCRH